MSIHARSVSFGRIQRTPRPSEAIAERRPDLGLDVASVLDVRMMLETHVAGLAAERSTHEERAELEENIERWVAAGDNVAAVLLLDVDFHRAIAKGAHNELYVALLDAISGALLECGRATLAPDDGRAGVLAEHRAIVTAIAEGDPAAARAAMETHLDGVARAFR
jgi:GntR family transcriptional repressor for pyruvate dehydrogenase complex